MPTATTFLQLPPTTSFAQSPVVFSVKNNAYLSSSFYYTCDLLIWSGSLTNSGSATSYTLRKYPNNSGAGIFEIGRFLNSELSQLAYQNTSNVVNYKATFNYNYNTTETGSSIESGRYYALDGYQVFPEPIGQNVTASSVYWPIMTSGPVSQSVTKDDKGWLSVYKPFSKQLTATYTGSYSDGSIYTITSIQLYGSATTASSAFFVGRIPTAPSGSGAAGGGFPLPKTYGAGTLVSYDIAIKDVTLVPSQSAHLHFDIDCAYKYTPVRILWKNRYGQFDFFNFYMKNIQTIETEQRTYQPQLGSWESSTLSYNNYQTAKQRYIVDSNETITVNTDFVSQDYNSIFKQLLVTDEVYWFYDQPNNLVKPLTIKSNSILFKTGVNDKLIQYTFTFDIGQPFKLVI